MKHYFLTGATGVLGSSVVPLLMESSDTELQLLIRARDDRQLELRLEELLAWWGWTDDDDKRRRIHVLRGDASMDRFGLNTSDYDQLASATTNVVHCAGAVRMNLSLDEARASAVDSARQIFALGKELARNRTLAKIEFVSTVGIAGKRQGNLPEQWIDEPREFHNTYEQAKAEAEQLARRAIEIDALPVTVHRPSMIVGDSRSGRVIHFQIFYFLCEFLSGRRTFGLYPDFGGVRLDILPSDCAATAIAAAAKDASASGRILHLASGPDRSPRIETLEAYVRDAFRRHGKSVPKAHRLSRPAYARLARLAAVFAPTKQRKALSTLPIYLDYLGDRQGFDNTGFTAWFEERGGRIPDASSYIQTVLDFYLSRSTSGSRIGKP